MPSAGRTGTLGPIVFGLFLSAITARTFKTTDNYASPFAVTRYPPLHFPALALSELDSVVAEIEKSEALDKREFHAWADLENLVAKKGAVSLTTTCL